MHTRWAWSEKQRKDIILSHYYYRLILLQPQKRDQGFVDFCLRLDSHFVFSFPRIFLVSVNRLNDENYFILFTLLWLPDSIRHGHFVAVYARCVYTFVSRWWELKVEDGGAGGMRDVCVQLLFRALYTHTKFSMVNKNKKSTNDSMRMTVRALELFFSLVRSASTHVVCVYSIVYFRTQHRKNFDLNYLHKEIFHSLAGCLLPISTNLCVFVMWPLPKRTKPYSFLCLYKWQDDIKNAA